MATRDRYATANDTERGDVPTQFDSTFVWEYEDGGEALRDLYTKAKQKQWDGASRIDWSRDLDPENPAQLPDSTIPIFASDVFQRLTPKELASVRLHFQSWQLSQFLHGEQGALLCAAKIVQQVPMLDAKYNAATQASRTPQPGACSRLMLWTCCSCCRRVISPPGSSDVVPVPARNAASASADPPNSRMASSK
jgi:hypothetical protein